MLCKTILFCGFSLYNKEVVVMFMNKFKKMLRNFIIFLIIVVLTFFFVFKNIDIMDVIKSLKTVNILYIVLGIVFMFIYLFLDGVNSRRVLRSLNNNITLPMAIKYAFVGFFYSSITPSATGGQPMQMYYMNKDGVKVSHGLLTCLVNLASYQFCLIALTFISIILQFHFLTTSYIGIKITLIIGLFLNAFVLFLTFASLFSPKVINTITKWFINILKYFKYRKVEELSEKMNKQVSDYHECSLYLKEHKEIFVKNILTMLLELIIYHSISYFIYRSFGLSSSSYITFLSLQILLFITTAALPFPGGTGITEYNFMFMYNLLYPATILGSAMILTRTVSFYLYVLITGLFIFAYYIYEKLNKRALR